jgi:hypothetical protein
MSLDSDEEEEEEYSEYNDDDDEDFEWLFHDLCTFNFLVFSQWVLESIENSQVKQINSSKNEKSFLFIWALINLFVEDAIKHTNVIFYFHFDVCTGFLVLHPLLWWYWVATEEDFPVCIWIFLLLDFVKPIKPSVAFTEAFATVLVQFALQTWDFAQMVGVEWFGFEKGQLLAVIVEEAKHFGVALWLLLWVRHGSG